MKSIAILVLSLFVFAACQETVPAPVAPATSVAGASFGGAGGVAGSVQVGGANTK